MIITKTPLRISFFGGGSDLPAFMEREPGAALSVTIDKFVYVIINKTREPLRFIHQEIEQANNVATMNNRIVSEILKKSGINKGMDIVSLSDVPATGSGLGGSSSFTVGLINGITRCNNPEAQWSSESLAKEACEIEIDRCGYPIGIQDQYAAAFGGFNLFEFYGDPRRGSKILSITDHGELEERLLLIYSGIPRVNGSNAGTILHQQQSDIRMDEHMFDLMRRVRDRAYKASLLLTLKKYDDFGDLLHENWMDKKKLSPSLSNSKFEEIYNFATTHGATGGKLLGAGGGGFFLFYTSPATIPILADALLTNFPDCKHYPFKFHHIGSTVTQV